MSNIRGFRDLEENNSGFGGPDRNDVSEIEKMRVPILSNSTSPLLVEPRKEGFCDMLLLTFCPRLQLMTFTMIIVLIDCVIFAVLCLNGIQRSGTFLEIEVNVLDAFGANQPQKIKENGEFWRFFTPMFLHADFLHIFFNSFATLILGSTIEYAFGFFATMIIYFGSGVCGNVFGALVSHPDAIMVGASTCIYGILACLISYMILNWDAMNRLSQDTRCRLLCLLTMIVVMIFMFSLAGSGKDSNVDHFGHFGGFIGGLLLGVLVPKPVDISSYTKCCKITTGIIFAIFLFGNLLMFYNVQQFK